MKWDDNTKNAVLIGLALGFFFLALPVVVNWAANGVLWASGEVASSLSTRLYRRAALGQKTTLLPLFLSMFTGAVFAMPTLLLMRHRLATWGAPIRKPVYAVLFGAVFAAPLVLVGIFEQSDLLLNLRFRQKLTIIAPRLDATEEKEFLAEWARMRNRADYESIHDRLDAVALKHKITFPPSYY